MRLGGYRPKHLWAQREQRAEEFMTWGRRHRALWPAAAMVAVTLVAYNLTLGSMFDYLRLETPLAYLPLLPLFSIGTARLPRSSTSCRSACRSAARPAFCSCTRHQVRASW
jgi:hypothetical protein